MQMHADFAGTVRDYVTGELDKGVGHRHLVVLQVHRLEMVPLAKRLKTGQMLRVMSGDIPRPSPEIVTFRVDRDNEWRVRHCAHSPKRQFFPRGRWPCAGHAETRVGKR